jgi:hypothetical protein
MAPILKVKIKWTGFTGAPGYTNFFFRDIAGTPSQATAEDAATKARNFGGYVRGHLPIETILQVQNDVEVIEETTGELQTMFTVATKTPLPGEAPSAPYSAASGAVVTWRTAGVRNGRRVRGRTFLVPLANSAYQSDGTLAAATVTALTTNLNTFLSPSGSANFGVYARPSSAAATDGIFHQATGFSVPDKVAVLRSRRD